MAHWAGLNELRLCPQCLPWTEFTEISSCCVWSVWNGPIGLGMSDGEEGERCKMPSAMCLSYKNCVLVTKTAQSSMLTATGSVLEVGELKPPYAGTCLSQGSGGGRGLGELTFLTVGRAVATLLSVRGG